MATADSLKLDDVERLLGLMQKHAVVEMHYRGLQVRRMPDSSPVRPSNSETELEILAKKPPDTIDAALMLRRTRGGV